MLRLVKRGSAWQVTGTVNGQRIRKGIKALNEQEAQLKRIEMERKMLAADKLGVRVKDLIDQYVAYRRPHSGTVYLLARVADKWGALDVGQMRLDEVRDWATDLGVADGTIRRYVKGVKAALYWGEKSGLYVLPRRLYVALPGEPEPRDRFLESMAEVRSLCDAADDWFKPFVVFLFHTGIRMGTVCALDWGQLSDTHVSITTRKGDGRPKLHRLPLNREAKWAVDQCAKRWGTKGHVFRSERGGVLWTQKVYEPWAKMCERAGVEDFTPHDARRTFATLLIRNGVASEVIQKLLCHESREMTERYAYLAPNQLANALGVLE